MLDGMNEVTPWGPLRGEDETPTPVRIHMPWHRGWLGSIELTNGNTVFKLSRRQALSYIESLRKRGEPVEFC